MHKETLRLRILEGHKDSGNLPPVAVFLAARLISTDVSWTGVEGHDGDCGVPGRHLSVDTALVEIGDGVLVIVLDVFGEGQRLGVGNLYLEVIFFSSF